MNIASNDLSIITHQSIELARKYNSKLFNALTVDIFGFSSPMIRHLINNLCQYKGTVFLEVGSFRGATLVAALYKNEMKAAYAIDNFCDNPMEPKRWKYEDGGWNNIRLGLHANLAKWQLTDKVMLFDMDARKVPLEKFTSKPNVIHIDCRVEKQELVDIVQHLSPAFEKSFILLVSQYNHESVQQGVDEVLKNFTVKAKHIFKTTSMSDNNGWYAGLGIFVLESK